MDPSDLKLSSFDVLDNVKDRSPCQQCRGASRRYFCYTCCNPMPTLVGLLPHVRLPVNIDIVRHPKEKHGKSTGVQCAILAPDNVRLFLYPDFPDYRKEKAILVFPDTAALTFDQLSSIPASENDQHARSSLLNRLRDRARFVLIDCTWFQVGGMLKHDHFQSMSTLALDGRRTRYWRPQHNQPDGHVATVEAVYYLCLDYEKWRHQESGSKESFSYDGRYDDLLYFFEYFWRKVYHETKAREERRKRKVDE